MIFLSPATIDMLFEQLDYYAIMYGFKIFDRIATENLRKLEPLHRIKSCFCLAILKCIIKRKLAFF